MRTHEFAALKRLVFVSAALLSAATRIAAQATCPASEQVGWLGIDGIICNNCEFGPGYARFGTEPRINNVAPNSPAADILRPGDVISSVNGALITTEDGADRYVNLKPGQSLTLLVRREGQLVTARFNNIPGRCPNEDRVRAATAVGEALAARGIGRGMAGGVAPSMARLQRRGIGLGPGVAAGGFPAHVSRVIFGFGISCSDCEPLKIDRVSNGETTLVWKFNSAPTLYSVETDGPAWRAGLRRGDVITEIDGIDVTREEAGRRFGAVQPGQNVRFTYRRGNDTRTAAVTAVAPAGIVVAASGRDVTATESSIRRMQDLLNDISAKERAEQAFVDRLKSSDDERLRDAVRKYEVDQAEQSRKLRELQAQLAATETRIRPMPGPRLPGGRGGAGSTNTMRYSGHLGSTDIEIRGSRPVLVDESPDEIVIRTGDAEIRLKRRPN